VLPHDEQGAGTPVVLLHAGIADRTMWSEHLKPLAAAGHRVIAVDLPGFGEAPGGEAARAPWETVLETMSSLELEPAVLVGNSFGGAVALRIAAGAPDRVSALVLVSAPPLDDEASAQLEAAWAAEEAALERGDIAAAVAAVLEAWLLPDAPAQLRERVATMQRRALEAQAEAPAVSPAPDPLEEHPELVAQVTVPALVMAGEHDMPDFLDGADALAGSLPRARKVILEGAGHLAPLETPDAFRELLLEFLAG
jgi:pimeloyl-ACP methyl ester carboxylesterase